MMPWYVQLPLVVVLWGLAIGIAVAVYKMVTGQMH
jgi:hypothetical protein